MTMVVLTLAGVMVFLSAVLGVYRVVKGPLQLDRVLALDFLSIVGLAAVSLFYLATDEPMVLDIGLLLALIGFLTALVLGRYLERGGGR